MRTLIITLAVSIWSVSSLASDWTDGSGVTWRPLPIKSEYSRVMERCHAIGMRLPLGADLLDAIEYGIFDPTVNTAFAKDITSFDWMWTRGGDTLGAHEMVSRQGDTSMDEGFVFHYALCASW